MVTSKDVAALAGVSQSTVSYVMSGTRKISPRTRARVEAAMLALGYQPNANARALAGSRTNVIGLVVELSGGIQMAGAIPFIDTIAAVARKGNHDVVLVSAAEGAAGIERLVRRSVVDAIVLMDIEPQDSRLSTLRELGVPAVLIGRPDDPGGLVCVDYDSERAGWLAVTELLAKGAEEVLLLGEPSARSGTIRNTIALFEAGARAAADRQGVPVQVLEPPGKGKAAFDQIADCLAELVTRSGGVVARTPQAVDALLQASLLAHLDDGSVPVVGVCPDDYAETLRRPLTNVSPEPREVSRLAVEAVFAQLADKAPGPAVRLVQPRLTRR